MQSHGQTAQDFACFGWAAIIMGKTKRKYFSFQKDFKDYIILGTIYEGTSNIQLQTIAKLVSKKYS